MFSILFWLLLIGLAGIAWLSWGLFRRALFARRVEQAGREFRARRSLLESEFFAAAAASGKPRGLAWKRCEFPGGLILARDRANGELVGLTAVTISFEAIAGEGMEEVEAVGNRRAATAVFHWNHHEWSTLGRAIFNLEPREVLKHYGSSLDCVAAEGA